MPNDIAKLRRLMRAANSLRNSQPAVFRGIKLNARNALKYAWWFESFRANLRAGTFRFSYFKKDGSIREAIGTLNPALIPGDQMPKSGIDPGASPQRNGESGLRQEGLNFVYYDLSVPGWRSFNLDNFIGFVSPVN